jgi:hypothetical protein
MKFNASGRQRSCDGEIVSLFSCQVIRIFLFVLILVLVVTVSGEVGCDVGESGVVLVPVIPIGGAEAVAAAAAAALISCHSTHHSIPDETSHHKQYPLIQVIHRRNAIT